MTNFIDKKENKSLSLIERMKQKLQCPSDDFQLDSDAHMDTTTCKNCGAGRGKDDGLTRCAYCGYEFLTVQLTDGINIKKEDNSR